MSPKELLIEDLKNAPESAIRAELACHNLFPSEIINKDILINMLVVTYFPDN